MNKFRACSYVATPRSRWAVVSFESSIPLIFPTEVAALLRLLSIEDEVEVVVFERFLTVIDGITSSKVALAACWPLGLSVSWINSRNMMSLVYRVSLSTSSALRSLVGIGLRTV